MKFRISFTMTIGFLAMAGLLLIGGVVTILYTYRLQQITTDMLTENATNLKNAQELTVVLFHLRGTTFNYILDGQTHWIETLQKKRQEFKSWLAEARDDVRAAKERALLKQIAELFTQYEQTLDQAIRLDQIDPTDESKFLLLQASRELFDTIYEKCDQFSTINENEMLAIEEKIGRMNTIIRTAMYALIIVGVVLGSLLGILISRSIINPLVKLSLKIHGASGGTIVKDVAIEKGTELEELDQYVQELIQRINQTTADLEKSRLLLARVDKLAALGRMAAGVAHEIRNPLTTIKMLIYAQRGEAVQEIEKQNDQAVILDEIERMERFIRNFLDFARPSEPNYREIHVHSILDEVLAFLQSRLRQNAIEVHKFYQPDSDFILADADQMKQVLINLLLNSIEMMPDGGQLRIEISRCQKSGIHEEQNGLLIKISDTGPGIPAKIKDTLFDPFVSGKDTGTGLGLSIAHQIIHQHGGWIEAMNNPEGGATFSIHLAHHTGRKN